MKSISNPAGAHTCGIVGKNLKSGKMANIFALDPALPLFHLKNQTCRLHYDGSFEPQFVKEQKYICVKNDQFKEEFIIIFYTLLSNSPSQTQNMFK